MTRRAHSKRVTKKPKALGYFTEINGKNGSNEDASLSDKDEQDVVDSDVQSALLTAALGGDVMAHMACLAGMKAVSDYPDPMDHREAMTTSNAEEWA